MADTFKFGLDSCFSFLVEVEELFDCPLHKMNWLTVFNIRFFFVATLRNFFFIHPVICIKVASIFFYF